MWRIIITKKVQRDHSTILHFLLQFQSLDNGAALVVSDRRQIGTFRGELKFLDYLYVPKDRVALLSIMQVRKSVEGREMRAIGRQSWHIIFDKMPKQLESQTCIERIFSAFDMRFIERTLRNV